MTSSPRPGLELVMSFVAGVLFAVGLAVAGMVQPSKIVGFLDVAGDWDPSLAFVMAGAVTVTFVAYRLIGRRSAPLAGLRFHIPTARDIDGRLLLGATLFGIGWGLAGYCPGPGIVALASGSLTAVTFVAAMAAGMLAYEVLTMRRKPLAVADAEEGRPAPAP